MSRVSWGWSRIDRGWSRSWGRIGRGWSRRVMSRVWGRFVVGPCVLVLVSLVLSPEMREKNKIELSIMHRSNPYSQ